MRIFTQVRLAIGVCLVVLAAAPGKSRAQGASTCEGIANDVMNAIRKDAAKTLLIVEDALVINEGCAGDIVRAAILASKADAALVNQIVQTATGVAPKKAAVIADAASSAAPGVVVAGASAGGEVVEGQGDGLYEKNPVMVLDKNPVQVIDKNPVMIIPPEEVEEEFSGGYVSARGIYLIQPPPVGIPPPPQDCKRKCDNVPTSPCNNVCKPTTPYKPPHKVYGKDYAVK
jgi:hypothetical protein